jgi:hypothetical protein
MGFRAPEVAARPRSSSTTKRIPEQRLVRTLPPMLPAMKTKVIKRKFKNQEDTRTKPARTRPPAGSASSPVAQRWNGARGRRMRGGGGGMGGPARTSMGRISDSLTLSSSHWAQRDRLPLSRQQKYIQSKVNQYIIPAALSVNLHY